MIETKIQDIARRDANEIGDSIVQLEKRCEENEQQPVGANGREARHCMILDQTFTQRGHSPV